MLVMIWRQINVDVFFVDWEQPRVKTQMNFSVSAWRTYFVANEWNEIQTVRKTSLILQLAATTFLLKV
jgi:meckelin